MEEEAEDHLDDAGEDRVVVTPEEVSPLLPAAREAMLAALKRRRQMSRSLGSTSTPPEGCCGANTRASRPISRDVTGCPAYMAQVRDGPCVEHSRAPTPVVSHRSDTASASPLFLLREAQLYREVVAVTSPDRIDVVDGPLIGIEAGP